MSKSPSILLIHPSCFHTPPTMERVDIKMSIFWLAAYLRRQFPVTVADFEIEIGRPDTPIQRKRYERLVREYLTTHEFDILAISCWTSLSYLATMTVARICRELYPDKLIVGGGYHATARPREFVTAERLFDYVVCLEGEFALTEIANNIAAGRPSETKIIRGATVKAENLIPYDFDMIVDYLRLHNVPDGNTLKIYMSRGCPFGCSFCMEPAKERIWRAFPPAQAVDILCEAVERFRPPLVGIADACFGMRPAWRREFLKLLAERKPQFPMIIETRAEYLDEEDIIYLTQLDIEVQFGIESCSPDMLRIMQKTKQPEKYLQRFSEISRRLDEHHVTHRANLIFNHPGETAKTVQETFAFMHQQLDRDNSHLIWIPNGYMHFPGCDVDINRRVYEEQYGAKFNCGEWWKEEADPILLSQRVIPSRDLDGPKLDLWSELWAVFQPLMGKALALKPFLYAAKRYYPGWQSDTRFKNSA
jgi:radical SAM superfamily enzyme YgiQ (UPF0313 family)